MSEDNQESIEYDLWCIEDELINFDGYHCDDDESQESLDEEYSRLVERAKELYVKINPGGKWVLNV